MIAEILLLTTFIILLCYYLTKRIPTYGQVVTAMQMAQILPFVGHFLHVGLHPHNTQEAPLMARALRSRVHGTVRQLLGSIFSVQADVNRGPLDPSFFSGSLRVVVISEGPTILRAFASSAVAGRQSIKIFYEVSMNTQGKLKTKCSWEKRNCIGETLARQQMFMYTVNIFQKYTLKALGELSTGSTFGIIAAPYPFKVIFDRRKDHRLDPQLLVIEPEPVVEKSEVKVRTNVYTIGGSPTRRERYER